MRTLWKPLLAGLLLATTAAGALSTWVSWRAARVEVDELLDAELSQSVRGLAVLAQGLLQDSGERAPPQELPAWQGAMDQLGAAATGARGHAYERLRRYYLWRGERLLLRSQDAPALDREAALEGFGEVREGDRVWRSFRLDGPEGLRVLGLEPLQVRSHISTEIARGMAWPLVLELPLLALLIGAAVRMGSRSLRRIARAVSAQAGDRLQPIERTRVPVEIHGLVDAINDLLGRVDETLRRERRFIDEAAHELRTPVAGMRLHLSNLIEAEDEAARARALSQIQRGQARLERGVAQLLTLSRLGPGAPAPRSERVELSAQLPGWLAEWIDSGLANDDELELIAAPGCAITIDRDQLQLLLRNLVDNALRHGGRPARVRIEVVQSGNHVRLAVEDAGPGLPPDERARVLDPFYRPPGTRADGSGLGLSIVARVVELSGGQLNLGAGREGQGLRVEIAWPASSTSP
ncbi:sensor histidine kinase [Aquimonas voraii]|uniref:histidine kinase n=1 Tax=Aquimonas voraii TaxID=265719 RepID=A0A1G6XCZ8_9GAMM|nr:ATP-binding protein [Aquimonas voraii]SDD75175.1 two-component system, OmpR family, sensor histidine kinase QseC [Aquimonas voraii]